MDHELGGQVDCPSERRNYHGLEVSRKVKVVLSSKTVQSITSRSNTASQRTFLHIFFETDSPTEVEFVYEVIARTEVDSP